MSLFDWKGVSTEEFKEICLPLLKCRGFYNLKLLKENHGRDIVGETAENLKLEEVRILTRVIQCKRYIAKRLGVGDIDTSLAWAKRHRPDCYLLITTINLTLGAKEFLEKAQKDFRFGIHIIERERLENARIVKEGMRWQSR